MNAINNMFLKAVACGVVALAVTVSGSYAFVASTAVARVTPELVAKAHLDQVAKATLSALLQ